MSNRILPTSPSLGSSYVCDTLPPAKLASVDSFKGPHESSSQPPVGFDDTSSISTEDTGGEPSKEGVTANETPAPPQPPARKLCVRHQRMADEGISSKLQQSLDALPIEEREAVSALWSSFSSSRHRRRVLILQGLLTMCCFSQLSLLAEQLAHLIRIDPFAVLPREVSLRVLQYLDAKSLCRAAQVSRKWKSFADDDILWRGICEQHIGQKCRKCGWGLPRLDHKRHFPGSPSPTPASPMMSSKIFVEGHVHSERPLKRQRTETPPDTPGGMSPPHEADDAPSSSGYPCTLLPSDHLQTSPRLYTRPWKHVYSERLTIERNWRQGRCHVRTLEGHTDEIMCLQFSESLCHPSFPVLITGSFDSTARVWNLETGTELRCLKGHTSAVKALQFDQHKLITGSMDHTIRVWDWRSGKSIRTLTGHTGGVSCLHFDSNVLASGGADTAVRVWNLRTGKAFALRGHSDWVNSLQLWDSHTVAGSSEATTTSAISVLDSLPPNASNSSSVFVAPSNSAPQIDPGKMLLSGSDDGTIRLWDLTLQTCVRQFTGHVGQVQSVQLLLLDDGCNDDDPQSHSGTETIDTTGPSHAVSPELLARRGPPSGDDNAVATAPLRSHKTIMVSGSSDNTVKMWDIETGKTMRTLFGHVEGVWAVACDKLRLVTGSHDRTIKVWNREDGSCTSTHVGHHGAVTCIALGEDKIVSGSDDGTVKIWSFSG